MQHAKALFSQWRQLLTARYGPAEGEALAWRLLEHLAGVGRQQVILDQAVPAWEAQHGQWEAAVLRVAHGEPLQYVLGTATFADMHLAVGPGVLIPRPETEELAHWVAVRHQHQPGPSVWDACTGSGALLLALARMLQPALAVGTDMSSEALHYARTNGAQHWAAAQWLQQDLTNQAPPGSFDLVVSNPPYVRRAEQRLMADHVVNHEPHQALFVDDHDPLLFYRHLARWATEKLVPAGWLYVEINEALGDQTAQLFSEAGLQQVELRQDLQGKDRFIAAQRRP